MPGIASPYSFGPGLDQLFCQSNLGIVTKAGHVADAAGRYPARSVDAVRRRRRYRLDRRHDLGAEARRRDHPEPVRLLLARPAGADGPAPRFLRRPRRDSRSARARVAAPAQSRLLVRQHPPLRRRPHHPRPGRRDQGSLRPPHQHPVHRGAVAQGRAVHRGRPELRRAFRDPADDGRLDRRARRPSRLLAGGAAAQPAMSCASSHARASGSPSTMSISTPRSRSATATSTI